MFLYIDFETTYTKDVSLRKMSVREYLKRADILSLAYAFDNDAVKVTHPKDPAWQDHVDFIRDLVANGGTVVAHNASFDVRVLTQKLGMPWPDKVHCTMELAHYWTPNQPGGYSLRNLADCWNLPLQKLEIDFQSCTDQELHDYCAQDVEVCRLLHREAMARVPKEELLVHELAQQIKEVYFEVDQTKVAAAVDQFAANAAQHAQDASALLGRADAFGTESGQIKSVKSHTLKAQLQDAFGFTTDTISKKKINPEHLRQNEGAARVINSAGEANKNLSHKRRVGVFHGMGIVDCELTYFAAHTGRYSSRNTGRGLNLHNLPKRNPLIAKPIRSMFRLPDEYCFVRGDFANVEYRIAGWLTDCPHTTSLFVDPDADPYIAFWLAATGQQISKKHPARQLAKAAVLGLGFGMGLHRWCHELMIGLADPTFGVTLDDIKAVAADQGWVVPAEQWIHRKILQLGCPPEVMAVAYHTRELFHRLHPQFRKLADWLLQTCESVAGSHDPVRTIDFAYQRPDAPDRNKLDVIFVDDIQGDSLRVRVGNWPAPTVLWRDLRVRRVKGDVGLSTALAGNRGYRLLTPNITIENVVQSCARNALVLGKLALAQRGWPYVLSVHDEVMLVVPRDPANILNAKEALLKTYGIGNGLGYGNNIHIKPSDVTVTASLYEDESINQQIWDSIDHGVVPALP